MEHYSLYTATVTMYAGLFYVTGTKYSYVNSPGVTGFFLFLICAPNVLFFLYWMNHMRIEILKIFYFKNAFLFKIMSCGRFKYGEFE